MKNSITRKNAKRYLNKEEYNELDELAETLERGLELSPREWNRYDELLDKMQRNMRKEIAISKFERYEDEIKEDIETLRERIADLSKIQKVRSRGEAIDVIIKEITHVDGMLENGDPARWLPGAAQNLEGEGERIARERAFKLLEELTHRDPFDFHIKEWVFLLPRIDYERDGKHALVWGFNAYAVTTSEFRKVEHKKSFEGFKKIYNPTPRPIGVLSELHKIHQDLTDNIIGKFVTPWTLLRGLMKGKLEPKGCKVIDYDGDFLTYECEGYEPRVLIPVEFMKYFRKFQKEKGTPVEQLLKLGLIDEILAEILETESAPEELEIPEVSEKNSECLKKMRDCEEFNTYSEWAEVLGYKEKSGAYKKIKEFEKTGLIGTKKHKSGRGVKVTLTERGKIVLKSWV